MSIDPSSSEATVPVLVDTAWVDQTRERVATEFECGLCLDFRHLAGLGPCPACDPDRYAEHIAVLAMAVRHTRASERAWAEEETG